MSNNEDLLKALLGVSSLNDFVPHTRNEKILMNCITKSGTAGLEPPQSRIEVLLHELAEELSGSNPNVCTVTISVSPSGVADEYTLYDDAWGSIGNGLVHSLGVGSYIIEIHATGYGNESGYSSINFTVTQSDITAGTKTVPVTLVPRYQTSMGEFIHITDALNRSATISANADCNVIVQKKNVFETTVSDNPSGQFNPIIRGNITTVAGQKYTISFDTTNSGVKCYINSHSGFDEDYFFCDGTRKAITLTANNTNNEKLVTLISVAEASQPGLITNVQVELGEAATEYEEYSGQTLTLESGVAQSVMLSEGINNIMSDNAEATITLVY